MTPYYEHAGITIYNADCREVLSSLRHAGDVIVSDPPYNVGYHYTEYHDEMEEDDYWEMLRVVLDPPSVILHYPESLFKYAFSVGMFPEKCVAWVYNANTPRQWRMIAWFCNKPDFSEMVQPYKNPTDKRILARLAAGAKGARLYDWWEEQQVKNVSDEKTEHPCQIPIVIMQRIIQATTAERIIDPLMGSGTTLVAAKNLGRKAIGIEIEEKYCEIAAKRLIEETAVFDFQEVSK